MRLLVVGRLSGQLSAAVKMAMETGARVAHVETITQATEALRNMSAEAQALATKRWQAGFREPRTLALMKRAFPGQFQG